MEEEEVSCIVEAYFVSKGLKGIGKFNAFNHEDDEAERSLIIDLAIGPQATRGLRTEQQAFVDKKLFSESAGIIDPVIGDLRGLSLFPGDQTSFKSWSWEPNLNPLVGIAIEIENNLSKYFLGSLLAAAVTGRWGIVIIQDTKEEKRWMSTIQRMMHKGAKSPIPSNTMVISWSTLQQKISGAD